MKDRLFALQDLRYRDFNAGLLPTVDPRTIIGVRVPRLRALAKELRVEDLGPLPHSYHEEDMLHAFCIEGIRSFDRCIAEVDAFLPYVDNWAVCDSLRPKCFRKHKAELSEHIERWLGAQHPYTVRFAIEMLMVHYLDEAFSERYPEMVASVCGNDYYVNMMIAWYFATALAKQYDAVIGYLQNGKLTPWVHNKTIQKAVESFRITEEQKYYLRTLRT
ncbi:MAG: DNA alkylation repair protein [Oscillospiraceae bacterium]|nr:DNA alkylation repair protein [Oscillospiraceae bacterium]